MLFPGTKGVILRQTYRQLEDNVLPSIFKIFSHLGWQENREWSHHKTNHTITIHLNQGKTSEILYRPAMEEGKTLDEMIEYLKGLEVDFALLSEVVGIHYNIFLALKGRVGRWGVIGDKSRCQLMVEGNPPDTDTWVYDTWFKHIIHDPHSRETKKLPDKDDYYVVVASTYENRANLAPDYIKALEAYPENMKKKFLYGKVGYLPPDGIPVYENFNFELHVARDGLQPIPKQTIYRGWDLSPTGRYKACCWIQVSPNGCLNVLHEFLFDGAGLDSFFQLVMLQSVERFPDNKQYLDFSDPKAFDKSETDRQSPADIAMKYGIRLRAGETHFDVRKNAVDKFLTKMNGFKIDAKYCRLLIKGLRGSYRYQDIDTQDGRISYYPLKNVHSHLQDALQYVASKLAEVNKDDREKLRNQIRRRNPKVYSGKFKPEVYGRLKLKNRNIFN